MVFIESGSTYIPIAFCTSHNLSLNGNSVDISNKDTAVYGASQVGTINWEVTSSSMYCIASFEMLKSIMTQRKPVNLKFGLKNEVANEEGLTRANDASQTAEWTADSGNTMSGKAVITSLSVAADNGSIATLDATFTGAGPLA